MTAFPPNGAAPALTTTLMLPATTTETLLAEAEAHLIKVDPGLRPMIEGAHCKMFSPEGLQEEIDPFRSLVSSIMAQQVRKLTPQTLTISEVYLHNASHS